MMWFHNEYKPDGTKTFEFFGCPRVPVYTSPVWRFALDLRNVVTNGKLTLSILSSFWTERTFDELFLWAPTVFSLMWFSVWSAIQVPFVMSALAILGLSLAVISVITTIHDVLIWRIIQGPQLQVWPPEPPERFNRHERWIYINGVATGKTITRQNLQCLSSTFHNPVLAVNNRTYGFMGDVLECIVQRAFGFRTKETDIAREIIKSFLQDNPDDSQKANKNNLIDVDADSDNKIKKVVLVAHSQGGIIASQILDDLYAELPHAELAKLEVYTFGSAALTFRNPFASSSHTERIIPVMEHYCNEHDMVTSWGALSSVNDDSLPYFGKIFVFENQPGHLLNQHYLKHMFTGPEGTWETTNFQLRAARRDMSVNVNREKYLVGAARADAGVGQIAVKDRSKLWTYM